MPLAGRSESCIVRAVYDRALYLESTNTRGHRPRLQFNKERFAEIHLTQGF